MAAFTVVRAGELGWPGRLDALRDPPRAIWVRGEIPQGPAVAIVGARGADLAGRRRARSIATGLARAGVAVVSGGARGIDGAAHEGALEGAGRTVVVLAGGIDALYPPEHAALFEEVASSGALVAEAPPGTPPLRRAFLRRNRLVAALADACLVVQADERSGSLATARVAGKLGRPVLAVDWGAGRPLISGLFALFRAGARPVRTSADVLSVLGRAAPDRPDPAEDPTPPGLVVGRLARRVWAVLGEGDATVDEIVRRTGAKLQGICTTLLTLELQRLVVRTSSGRYGRIR
jgi:DNA processing protein